MAFLFSKSSPPIIQMRNPLHFDHNEIMLPQTEMGTLQSPKKSFCGDVIDGSSSLLDPVQRWSVEVVISWLRGNVPFQSERMEDHCQAFAKEGIDGLGLLALQRNNHACSGMMDSEWLLLYSARESLLLESTDQTVLSAESTVSSPMTPKGECVEDAVLSSSLPSRFQTSKTLSIRSTYKPEGFLWSSLRFLSFPSKHLWSPSASKYEEVRKDIATTQVFSLQDEILSAEEREAALKAKMDNLDEILRTAQLANYLYTRMRWTPLPGELPVDDFEVDDWLQRFLVLEGSALFFFPRAADLRPEGAILFSDIVEVGEISGKIQHDEENIAWFGFHVTTCDGLRLECATPLRLQANLWTSLIQSAHSEHHSLQDSKGS